MSRREDLGRLYEALDDLRERAGGYRYLRDCTTKSGWPERGVYFFFTEGELREDGISLRVVRVGTHAITDTSKTTLWHRLRTHRGVIGGNGAGGGNHRGSIFRKRVGEALIRTKAYPEDITRTWGVGSTAPKAVCIAERPLEAEVSIYIGNMPFLWLAVDDVPSPYSERAVLERNSIGLLSNLGKPPIDPPSPNWLGLQSDQRTIRESGLWNTNHVDERYEASFLQLLSTRVQAMRVT